MNSDLPTARRGVIASRLDGGQAVTASALATEFEVSEDAIRRDLRALAAEGRCRRVYGGALPIIRDAKPFAARVGEGELEKQVLARSAAGIITAGDFLFLDSGSTNLALVEHLPEDVDLTVATNSTEIASALMRRQDAQIIMTGGLVEPAIGGCVDAVAVQSILQMRFDIAFIGTCSVSEDGLAADHFEDATFKRAVVGSARRVVALATKDKIDRRALHCIAALKQVDTLIVGPEISDDQRHSLAAVGVRVVVPGRD